MFLFFNHSSYVSYLLQIIIIIETVHGRNIQQHPSHPHGGYKIEDSDINDGINATTIRNYCNIPIFDLNRHSIEQIQSSCFNAHRPCIINNVKHQYKNPITNEMINLYDEFNKTNFINKYGKLILRQNSPSEVPFSLPPGEATSVKTFFQNGIHQQKFIFGLLHILQQDNEEKNRELFQRFKNIIQHTKQINKDGTEIFEHFSLPKRKDANEKGRSHIISLGGTGGGITYHDHGATILNLIHGIKIWYLYKPGTRSNRIHQQSNHFFKSNWKTVSWHDSNKEEIPIICAQRGGSTLYLPQFWAVCVF